MGLADLVVGCECGGSDGTSGLAGNPVVGRFFDRLVDAGGTAVFEETVEMIGLRDILLARAEDDGPGGSLPRPTTRPRPIAARCGSTRWRRATLPAA